MRDDYGNTIKAGDKLRLIVGIPGREVVVTVMKKRGRLVTSNAERQMRVRGRNFMIAAPNYRKIPGSSNLCKICNSSPLFKWYGNPTLSRICL